MPWCPTRKKRPTNPEDHSCKACVRKGPDFQVGDRVAAVKNNNHLGRKFPGIIVDVRVANVGPAGSETCYRGCTPLMLLLTCGRCHCPKYYIYDVKYDVGNAVGGVENIEKGVAFSRIFPSATRAIPVVPEADVVPEAEHRQI